MKAKFKSEEPKKIIYCDYPDFSSDTFVDKFLANICQEKHDFSDFDKKFVDTLSKNAPNKIKTF